jgi:hypothetical protein
MQIETKKAIAESIAKHLVKTSGKEVGYLTIVETVGSELLGLEGDEQDSIEKFVQAYVEVASVFVNIETYRVDDQGNIRSNDEMKMQFDQVAPEF